jgi:hypothetical protein
MYLGELDIYAPMFPSYILCNSEHNIGRHKFIKYNETTPFWKYWIESLEQIDTKYFIYMQEDFILLDKPNINKIKYYIDFLDRTNYSFVKFIANDLTGFNNIESDLFDIPAGHEHFFCMQACLWKKEEFIKLFNTTKAISFGEYPQYSLASRRLGMKGSFVYNGQPKRGLHHYDSFVFPVIATAIVKKKWNISEYKYELDVLSKKYNIDMSIRGYH